MGDILLTDYEYLFFEPLLEFAGLESTEIPCYSIQQQIAEKLHALTRGYVSGTSTRGKDLVDILLLANLEKFERTQLSRVIHSTFNQRGTNPIPEEMPTLSNSLRNEYNRLARELEMRFDNFDNAESALAVFINPVLLSSDPCIWNVDSWRWE